MLGKIEGKRRRGQQRMRLIVSIINLMDMNLSKLWEIVEARGVCMLQSLSEVNLGDKKINSVTASTFSLSI